jgi:hypothetical protein
VIGDKILEQPAAKGRRLTGLEEAEILDQIRHTLQWPFGKSCRDGLERLLVLLVHDRINGRIELFGPCDSSLQHSLGTDLALGDKLGKGDGIMLAIFFKPHGLQIPN